MATTLDDQDVRALVHVAGPVERELGYEAVGYVYVQRCLRCDDLLAVWKVATPPRNAFRLGRLVAADPYQGIAGGREAVGEVGPRDKPCAPIPVGWL